MSVQYHATHAQQAVLVRHQIDPGFAADNVAHAWRLEHDLDLARFTECLRTVLAAAAPLGDTFHVGGGEWTVRRGPVLTPDVVHVFELVGEVDPQDEAAAICEELAVEADRGMDVSTWPLCRVRLIIGAQAHYLTLLGSHLVVDAYTGYALVTAVSRLYDGTGDASLLERLSHGPEAFPEPPVGDRALQRLRADVAGVRSLGTLTVDGMSPEAPLAGTTRVTTVPARLVEDFRGSRRVRQFGAFPVLLAAHARTLSILGDRPDAVISVPLANRRGIGQRGASGDFVNTLMMHLPVEEMGTDELLETSFLRLCGLQHHQHVPLGDHLSTVLPGLPTGLQPDNIFTAYKKNLNFVLGGIPAQPLAVPRRAVSHPLVTTVARGSDGTGADVMRVTVAATPEIAAADPGRLYLRCLADLLDERRDHRSRRHGPARDAGVTSEDPGTSPHAGPGAQESPDPDLDAPGGTDGLPDQPLARRFMAFVRSQPDSPAVLDASGRSLSYGQLHELAEARAALYRAAGCRAVVVSQPRGMARVVSLMATQLAGVVHVPVEPTAPAGRLERIVEVLRDEYGTVPVLDGEHPAAGPLLEAGRLEVMGHRGAGGQRLPVEDAYLIFTSGSMGRPKVIPITPTQVLRFVDSFVLAHDIDGSDRWVQFHSTSFDFSVLEILGALLTGGAVVTLDESQVLDPARFLAVARQLRITVLTQTPSALRRWRDRDIGDADAYSWRILFVGAERVEEHDLLLWQRHFGTRARVFNVYGPTETTVIASSYEIDMSDLGSMSRYGESLIGRAIPGVRIAVVDRHGRPVPPGVAGEIAIAGDGVGRGYLDDGGTSQTRFGDNPWLGRTYYSGDRGRMGADGLLSFLGRKDEQVQIRGHRVELGEIERALLAAPGVVAAHAMIHDGGRAEPDLIGFVAGAPSEDPAALRRRLAEALPRYMVPGRVIVCAEFPVNQSGKIDARALAELVDSVPAPRPSTGEASPEARISAIFAETIGVPQVGADTGFMDAGGTSMHLVTAHERLVKELDWPELELVDIFAAGTARRLAELYVRTASTRKVRV